MYAEKPYLYGPLGSSLNVLWVGQKVDSAGENGSAKEDSARENGSAKVEEEEEEGENGRRGGGGKDLVLGEGGEGMVFEEGGEGDGEDLRREKGVPETEAGRKKWFLQEENRREWEFEAGREFYCDFFNPYLDFNGASCFYHFLMFCLLNLSSVLLNLSSMSPSRRGGFFFFPWS